MFDFQWDGHIAEKKEMALGKSREFLAMGRTLKKAKLKLHDTTMSGLQNHSTGGLLRRKRNTEVLERQGLRLTYLLTYLLTLCFILSVKYVFCFS